MTFRLWHLFALLVALGPAAGTLAANASSLDAVGGVCSRHLLAASWPWSGAVVALGQGQDPRFDGESLYRGESESRVVSVESLVRRFFSHRLPSRNEDYLRSQRQFSRALEQDPSSVLNEVARHVAQTGYQMGFSLISASRDPSMAKLFSGASADPWLRGEIRMEIVTRVRKPQAGWVDVPGLVHSLPAEQVHSLGLDRFPREQEVLLVGGIHSGSIDSIEASEVRYELDPESLVSSVAPQFIRKLERVHLLERVPGSDHQVRVTTRMGDRVLESRIFVLQLDVQRGLIEVRQTQ